MLERRKQGLESLVQAAQKGPLVPFNDVLVVVDQSLVQQLLSSAIPFERTIKDKYRLNVDKAAVSFDDNFSLIQLNGRVSLASRPQSTFAEVALYGALDVVELDPFSGVLRGRVKVIALDATKVSVLGIESKTAEKLLEDLASEKVDDFASAFSNVDIPVKLQREVVIPAFGPEGSLTIAEARIPISGSVLDVKAFRGRLFVTLAAVVHPGGEGETTAKGASS